MSRTLLELDSEDLQRVLLAHARKDGAPSGARERVLAGVGVGVGAAALWPSVASASSAGSGSTAGKIAAWVAAKWLVIGLGSGVVTLSAAEVISRPSAPTSPSIVRRLSAAANPAPQLRAVLLADAEGSQRPVVTLTPGASAVSASAAKLNPFAADRPSNTDARALAESSEPSPLPSVVNFQVGTVASAANDSPRLADEVRALEAARAALARASAAHAFELLNDYAQAFPNGALRVEAAALYLETVAKQGNRKRALELAEQFLKHHPESPLASRVRALAESYRRRLHNP